MIRSNYEIETKVKCLHTILSSGLLCIHYCVSFLRMCVCLFIFTNCIFVCVQYTCTTLLWYFYGILCIYSGQDKRVITMKGVAP